MNGHTIIYNSGIGIKPEKIQVKRVIKKSRDGELEVSDQKNGGIRSLLAVNIQRILG